MYEDRKEKCTYRQNDFVHVWRFDNTSKTRYVMRQVQGGNIKSGVEMDNDVDFGGVTVHLKRKTKWVGAE